MNQHFSQLQKLADRVEFCNEWIQMDGIVLERLEDEVKRAHERSKPPRKRESEKGDQGDGKGKDKEKGKEPELESLDGTGEKKDEVNGKEEEKTNRKAQESVNEDKLQSETETKIEEEPEGEKEEAVGNGQGEKGVEEPQSKTEKGKSKEPEDSDEHPQNDGGNDEKPEENKGKGKLVSGDPSNSELSQIQSLTISTPGQTPPYPHRRHQSQRKHNFSRSATRPYSTPTNLPRRPRRPKHPEYPLSPRRPFRFSISR